MALLVTLSPVLNGNYIYGLFIQLLQSDRLQPENVDIWIFPPRDELSIFYSSVGVFVTASTADTWGLSTLEANTCGTFVAAADVSPLEQTIGVATSERFEYSDRAAMVDAIENCLRTERDTRAAVERYDVRRTMDDLEYLYRSVQSSTGRLEVTVVNRLPPTDAVTEAVTKWFFDRETPHIRTIEASKLEIVVRKDDPVRFSLDGERREYETVEISVRPQALRVCVGDEYVPGT